jgi:DNA-binding NarL/FixJ family response regulator
MIRVLIADDQALVRRGFRMILEVEQEIEIVGEAADGEAAVRIARELQPDIVLMDVRMPGMDGINATRAICDEPGSATKVVMLTTFDLDEYLYEALQAGASGFLLKDVQPEFLVAGIQAVHSGESLLSPSLTSRVVESFLRSSAVLDPRSRQLLRSLTNREKEILQLIARGLSNAEMATQLHVSETTVKTHVSRVLMKLGLRDRVQAVIFAYESGLVTGRPGHGRTVGPEG